MKKRTQVIAPALVIAVLLFGAYRLSARPGFSAAQATRPAAAGDAEGSATPALLAAAGADLLAASAAPTSTPGPTHTPTATATRRPTSTPLPTSTATPIPTATPLPEPPDRIVAAAIGLDSPVVTIGWHEVAEPNGNKHTEWDVASYAAGWHKNSARPGQAGNVVLSGHNNIEGEVFRNLERFQVGDEITLYAGEHTFTYTVSEKFVLPDKGVSYEQQVENAQWIGSFPDERLTLVSCWPPTNNTHRIFVIAKPKK